MICQVHECKYKREIKGYCGVHYRRVLKHGHPQVDKPIVKRAPFAENRFYKGYRKFIIERDRGACVLCFASNRELHVHHIVTRGAGGKDEFHNLVTLCSKCHREKAHGPNNSHFREILTAYVKQFSRPEYWGEVMEKSERDATKVRTARKKYMKKWFQKVKTTEKWGEYKTKRASEWQRLKQHYLKTYGMTMNQYRYRKSKGIDVPPLNSI